MGKASFGSFQAVISLLAGLASITGAAYSAVHFLKPGTGEIRIVVRTEKGRRPLPGSAIEVLTADDALVTTLTTGDDGSARQPVRVGTYRLRVAAARFEPQTRDVRVEQATAADVRFDLARHEDTPPAAPDRSRSRPVSRGVGAAERFFRRLGL